MTTNKEILFAYIAPALKRILRVRAKQDGRSVSRYVERILEELARPGGASSERQSSGAIQHCRNAKRRKQKTQKREPSHIRSLPAGGLERRK